MTGQNLITDIPRFGPGLPMIVTGLEVITIVDRRSRRPLLVEIGVVIEVVVKAENPACFSIHDQGGIGSHLPVRKLGNEIDITPSIAIVRTSLERDVDVAGVLKIPGGVAAGIDYREEITVLGRDDCRNPEVLGSTVSLRENHLAKGIGQERELVFFLKGGLTERT
jgi:hypothetical protein